MTANASQRAVNTRQGEHARPRVWPCFVVALLVIPAYTVASFVYYWIFEDEIWYADGSDWAYGGWRMLMLASGGIAVLCSTVFLAAILGGICSRQQLSERLCLRWPRMGFGQLLAIAIGSIFVSLLSKYVLWVAYLVLPEFLWSVDGEWDPYWYDNNIAGVIILAISTGLFPGIAEELLFRGYIQGRFLKRWPAPVAIGVTSVLFGIYHGNVEQFFTTTFMGVWLGVLAWRTGSVLPGIVAHFAINVFASLYHWLSYEFIWTEQDYWWFELLAGIVTLGFFYLSVRAVWKHQGFVWRTFPLPWAAAPSASVPASLDQLVAESLDADAALLPQMSAMLADVQDLGGDSTAAAAMIASSGDAPGRALDLGCGKGALAIALAGAGWDCTGVDGYAPFVESAKLTAQEQGVTDRCRFLCDDLRSVPIPETPYDLVACCGVGPFAGGFARTIAALARHVKPGGLILIEDGFLADDAAMSEAQEFVGYAHLGVTRAQLTGSGASIIAERISAADESAQANAALLEKITPRAESLRHASPELDALVGDWLQEQRRQNELLGRVLIPAIWLLRMPA